MRPVHLRFRAFGPYAEEQELDFRLLEPHRVFLICGPTGAGKTSILDAMCFALYGETSGGERDPKRVRSDHAKPGEVSEVHFEFRVGDEHFAVWRTPEQERPKKRGKGTTVSPGEAAIWRRDGSGAQGEGTLLATQPRQVTETVVRLLGFHCAQFRQVIVLPQGQFRRVLMSSSKEREKILETLFQTEMFRRIEEALKAAAKREHAALEDLRRRRELVLGQLDLESQEGLVDARAALARECTAADERLAAVGTTVAETEASLAVVRESQRAIRELAEAEAEHTRVLQAREKMDAQHVELERARRAAGVADVALVAAQREAELVVATVEAGRHRSACETATREHQEAAAAMVREEQNATERQEAQAAVDRLEGLSGRAQELDAARRELALRTSERDLFAEKRAKCARTLADVRSKREAAAAEELQALADAHQQAAVRLASELEPGRACPVCGSEDHPAPAAGAAPGTTRSEAALTKLRKRVAELTDRETATMAELSKAEECERDASRRHAEQQGRVEMCEGQVPKRLRDPGALRRAQREARERCNALLAAQRIAQERVDECERALAKARVALDAAQQHETTACERAQASSALLRERLTAASFQSREEFDAASREPAEIERLAAELREFESAVGAAQMRLRRARRATVELEEEVPDPAPLQARLDAARTELDELRRTRGALEERLRQMDNRMRELEAVAELTTAAEGRYGIAGRLAEVAGGQNAQGVTFQRFVLAALLEDVLAEATRRLRLMSHGRFELKRARERADLRASGGLDLEVFDAHTSTTRPVASLSGGESFLASLALALGLSDVVQQYAGGIKLETVFVDEGFGSLDAEAIDLAFRTLVDLRGEGRLVGVISHVPELEERIGARLRVTRGVRGSAAHFAV